MHRNYPRAFVLVVALSLSAPALAGPPDSPPKEHPTPTAPPTHVTVTTSPRAAADADADADARAKADADADAAAESAAKASSGGNVLSTTTDVLALDLPGHAAATAVATDCAVSRGSLGAWGVGSGGRVKIDPGCAAHVRCLENVATLAGLGQNRLAVQLAAQCAGLELPADYVLELPPPPVPARDPGDPYVTHEDLRRAFETALGKH